MSDTTVSSRVSGYHDFGGLASLRGDAASGDTTALRETAKQFETYFLQQVMKTMREAMERSDLVENRDADQFQELMDKEVAMKMAERGSLGLADMLERQVRQRGQPTAAEALDARARSLAPQAAPMPLGGQPAGLAAPAREGLAVPHKLRALVKGLGHE
ncbi:rod-binding protein [Ramlibacter sp. MAHUQ-53]|uniref:rod-binding protein n=1 Tax=unclassified Ramlibacter TaxID=2617605 RepID=UPI00363E0B82